MAMVMMTKKSYDMLVIFGSASRPDSLRDITVDLPNARLKFK
jgi:hypothetical protein